MTKTIARQAIKTIVSPGIIKNITIRYVSENNAFRTDCIIEDERICLMRVTESTLELRSPTE